MSTVKLLSLPPNTVKSFFDITSGLDRKQWFCASDPKDRRVSSGGATAWLLQQYAESRPDAEPKAKKIIIHGDGQSRRLPAYAPVGKLLAPIPVMRWSLGQTVDQTLLSMQVPLYEQLMERTPAGLNTMVASGDMCLRIPLPLPAIPDADVVCLGMWVSAQQGSRHGVMFSKRDNADFELDFMLQKPSVDTLNELAKTHHYLMDVGLWLLSDKAVERLDSLSRGADGQIQYYDLYSTFGTALGVNPSRADKALADLSVAIVPVSDGGFYHFGTTRELISSTLALQTLVTDQRYIMNLSQKPTPALFVQNCRVANPLTANNHNVWIENAVVSRGWTLSDDHVITGVPDNDWSITLPEGACVDVVPIGESDYALRPYGYDDVMRGSVSDTATLYQGKSIVEWLTERNITLPCGDMDIQSAPLFPVLDDVEKMGIVARWMIAEPQLEEGRALWIESRKLSADEITEQANLLRLTEQRNALLRQDLELLRDNHRRSIYYQLDLDHLAHTIHNLQASVPHDLGSDEAMMSRIRNLMLQATIASLSDDKVKADTKYNEAFALLREGLVQTLRNRPSNPHRDVYSDQIVWARSPLRIDLAGGWTDTPPYSINKGGSVVNLAVQLNGQQPLQVFVKPSADYSITLRSIDLGAEERINDYDALTDYQRVGSPFSLPKAALALAGFVPQFSKHKYSTLADQLHDFGSGMEITLLSAVPAGSGLGTSSILAATVLGALNDFCGLAWDTEQICWRTMVLEQLLTTGGGWQDQCGGVLGGVKLLSTTADWLQQPKVNWLPDGIFTDVEYAPCHLLYYTGITRTAKNILSDIVRRMFLNHGATLRLLDAMGHHAVEMAEAIQRRDFYRYGELLARTWEQNKQLDAGTNPAQVQAIIDKVQDYMLGCKLPGAGGGGFLYMVAKDPDAAARIRHILEADRINDRARFVDMTVSQSGLQISRS